MCIGNNKAAKHENRNVGLFDTVISNEDYQRHTVIHSEVQAKEPEAEKQAVKIDTAKVKVGVNVSHSKFGDGKITEISGNKLTVSFYLNGKKRGGTHL
jgi:hypothetical protein